MYVILRTDQGGGYVSQVGTASSYVRELQRARTYPTRDAADRDRCPGNEITLSLSEAMERARG